MNLDEQFSENADKQMLNQLVNENVSSIKLMNLKKAALCGLFFYFPKNKFIVFFLFLLFKDFFEAKTHA